MVSANLTDSLRDALTLAQAAHLFSPIPHVSTLHRWRTKGTRGVKLRTWLRGGVFVTTAEAVEQFLRQLNAGADEPGDSPSDTARRSREAARALEAIGA